MVRLLGVLQPLAVMEQGTLVPRNSGSLGLQCQDHDSQDLCSPGREPMQLLQQKRTLSKRDHPKGTSPLMTTLKLLDLAAKSNSAFYQGVTSMLQL